MKTLEAQEPAPGTKRLATAVIHIDCSEEKGRFLPPVVELTQYSTLAAGLYDCMVAAAEKWIRDALVLGMGLPSGRRAVMGGDTGSGFLSGVKCPHCGDWFDPTAPGTVVE